MYCVYCKLACPRGYCVQALSGLNDTRVEAGYIQHLHDRASSTDKMLHRYPGMVHQLLQESEANKAQVFGDITEWLLQRMPAAAKQALRRDAAEGKPVGAGDTTPGPDGEAGAEQTAAHDEL
jgi:hypothetical protein